MARPASGAAEAFQTNLRPKSLAPTLIGAFCTLYDSPHVVTSRNQATRPRRTLVSEVEQVKKVANGRPVGWNIIADHRVVRRVWEVIAAAAGDRRQAPVVFD